MTTTSAAEAHVKVYAGLSPRKQTKAGIARRLALESPDPLSGDPQQKPAPLLVRYTRYPRAHQHSSIGSKESYAAQPQAPRAEEGGNTS
ncbi:hypothetical protein F66182_9806 [Fusarium sp. NRRL 66182]|nr:hypothetical protein F66182_9806 [Fusarium sp. NRRL 66182]